MLLILENCLEIEDFKKYKKNKIIFIANNEKRYVIIVVYYFL